MSKKIKCNFLLMNFSCSLELQLKFGLTFTPSKSTPIAVIKVSKNKTKKL